MFILADLIGHWNRTAWWCTADRPLAIIRVLAHKKTRTSYAYTFN